MTRTTLTPRIDGGALVGALIVLFVAYWLGVFTTLTLPFIVAFVLALRVDIAPTPPPPPSPGAFPPHAAPRSWRDRFGIGTADDYRD